MFLVLKIALRHIIRIAIEAGETSIEMSQDLELAIVEGSNLVRIGTSVFGNRFLGKEIWNENITE